MSDTRLTVTDTAESFDTWISKEFIPESLRSELEPCQVLIVPELGFRNYEKPLFPVGTEMLLHTLRSTLGPAIAVNICIADNDYAELALHSNTWRIGCIIVTHAVLPLFLSVMGNYIYGKMKADPETKDISFTLTVVDDNRTSKQITYEGAAKDFPVIAENIKNLWTHP